MSEETGKAESLRQSEPGAPELTDQLRQFWAEGEGERGAISMKISLRDR